jgi:hypothetical protein
MKNTVVFSAIWSALLLVAVIPGPAHAIQTHAAPEGLYVHQVGHILFAIAMLGFAFRIRQSKLSKEKSWRLMSTGAVLFALWNGWAFIGHIIVSLMPQAHFSRDSDGLKSILTLHSPLDVLFYLFKMDHLICFPALVFIYIALRQMTARPVGTAGDENNSL